MFALRGIAVSLTFFVLLYSILSALVSISWRSLRWLRATEKNLADLLFLTRILPLLASLLITLAFVVPSFQLLEPRSIDEDMGALPVALGIAALFLIGWGCYRVITAQLRTWHIVSRWLDGSQPLYWEGQPPALRSRREAPPLIVVGMRKPRVLVSDSTLNLLTQNELQIALEHELAHVRSRDNLKKLVFRFSPFPGMAKLEAAWSQAAELAADDAAVSNVNDAVDLAAALVKLSRLVSLDGPVDEAPACTIGFVTGSVTARVTRLLAWSESRKPSHTRISQWAVLPPLVVAAFCLFVTYGSVLVATHQLTEWLVR